MDETQLERLVLEHINNPNYRPVKPRVIAKQLGLSKEDRGELKKAIKRLVKQGKLGYGVNHLIQRADKKPGSPEKLLVGVFRRAAGGFGFVRPTGTDRRAGREDDVYISRRQTLDAVDGDVVAVRLNRKKHGQRHPGVRGEIVEVLERDTHQFVGTYFESEGTGFAQIDGTVFAQAILVGDAGAKNARAGDKVVVEMVRFPSHLYDGEGVVVEVLGPRGAPGVDTKMIMREFRLVEAFPDDVADAAREEAEKFDESIGDDRLDLTGLTVVTIDPEDARDFDDAISLERIEKGHWRLGVHIADVSHFVRPGTPLDKEARKRATSVYLPDRVIPMLPEIVSNNLASLQPNRVRYARTAFIEFTSEGVPVAAEVHRTAIRSDHRFNYDEVDDYLKQPQAWRQKLAPQVHELVGRMYELAMILRKRRLELGAIELTLPEIKIELDADGKVSGAHLVKQTESHQIIEEFMLAANEAVAGLLEEEELLFLRRIHQPPDPRKLHALTEFVRELGISCESLESRFEIKRVISEVEQRPERHAVNYAVLRSMQKAIYSPIEEGHYALASAAYCHFTSPIRRYPDLAVHRMFDSLAKGERPPNDFDQLALLGEHCSEREQRAEKAERELIKIKLLNLLSQRIGTKMDAVITGVEQFGIFAQGLELPADGLIHVNSLVDDYYDYDSKTHTLCGRSTANRYRLGDVIRVEIARVDVDRRELDFRFVKSVKHAKPAAKKRASKATNKSTAGRRKQERAAKTTRKGKQKRRK